MFLVNALFDLARRPHIGDSFFPVNFSVQGRIETAFGIT
jgi:hypothetical protein